MEINSITMEAAKGYAGTLCDLYRSGCMDMGAYREVAGLVPIAVPGPEADKGCLMQGLQSEMDGSRLLVTELADRPYSRAMAGMEHMRRSLYGAIKDTGYGAMLEFYFKHARFHVKVAMRLSIGDIPFEAADEREGRMFAAAAQSPFKYVFVKKTGMGRMMLPLCGENIEALQEWASGIFGDDMDMDMEAKGGYIWGITCHAPSFPALDGYRDNAGDKEKIYEIVKIAHGIIGDANMAMQSGGSLQELAYRGIAGGCYRICVLAGAECGYAAEYAKVHCANRDKNADTQERVYKLGASVPQGEVTATMKDITGRLCEAMEAAYGGYVDMHATAGHFHAEQHFGEIGGWLVESEDGNGIKEGYRLPDLIRQDQMGNYYIPAEFAEKLKEAMESDGLDVMGMEIDYSDMGARIKTVKFQMHGLQLGKWL